MLNNVFTSEIKVTYVDHMGDDLRVVNAARISFGNESPELSDKDRKLIDYLAKHQHLTPFEHNVLTVVVECPLYIRSQIMRHRTFAFNEISRRYSDENISFYVPPEDDFRKQAIKNKQASEGRFDDVSGAMLADGMRDAISEAYGHYLGLLEAGVAREQARAVLPQSLMTKFYQTGNLRNWTHFLKLRLDKHAQSEVVAVAEQVMQIMMDKFPEATKALLNENVL